MPVSDPIADMLTRIRNANRNGAEEVAIPASRLKVALAKLLREEGFIKHYKVARVGGKEGEKAQAPAAAAPAAAGEQATKPAAKPLERQSVLHVYLKYGPNGEQVIAGLKRLSKPGLRRYVGWKDIQVVQGGLGITVISTSRGLLTGAQSRKRQIGGELLCAIW
jgi:small subunit ribosomal protein S8